MVQPRTCNHEGINIHPDIELLAVGLKSFYQPREFTAAIVVTAYAPPSAVVVHGCDAIHSTNVLLIINRDLNHVDISKTLTNSTQYVICSTTGDMTLDLLYVNVKEASSAHLTSQLPPTPGLPTSS